jgi:5-deoxy-glucuronate isomerase
MKKDKIYYPAALRTKSQILHISSASAPVADIDFKYLKVAKNTIRRLVNDSCETMIVLLSGKVKVSVADRTVNLGPRKDVFRDKSQSIYTCGYSNVYVQGLHKNSEFIVIMIPRSKKKVKVFFPVQPRKVKIKQVGKGDYRRKVHTIFERVQSKIDSNLIVGETFNEPGKWSSYPPHKHSVEKPPYETRYEEIYFFKIKPHDRFGYMRVYDNKTDSSISVCNDDAVIVTDGYHPVCALPHTRLYYFWVLYGRNKKLINSFDPKF